VPPAVVCTGFGGFTSGTVDASEVLVDEPSIIFIFFICYVWNCMEYMRVPLSWKDNLWKSRIKTLRETKIPGKGVGFLSVSLASHVVKESYDEEAL
jgi:hypothetical protein